MDMEKRMEELEKSLQRNKWTIDYLQKRLRLHRRIGLAACCVVAVLAVWAIWPGTKGIVGAASGEEIFRAKTIVAETIIAKKFGLKPDRSGKFLSGWGMGDDGPMFFMSDNKDGDSRQIFMALDDDGPALGITDTNGKPRLSIKTMKRKSNGKEYPAIFLFDKNGRNHILLMARDRKASGLAFFDSSGEVRISLGLLDKENPGLALSDKNGKFRADMSLSESGQPKLELMNEKEKVIWSAPPVSK